MLSRNPPALWAAIPSHLHGGIARWLIRGIEPGSFLYAACLGGLPEAAALADDVSLGALGAIGLFVHLYFPAEAQSSDCWRRGKASNATRAKALGLSLELHPDFLAVLLEATKL